MDKRKVNPFNKCKYMEFEHFVSVIFPYIVIVK